VVGCSDIVIDTAADRATLAGSAISVGDWITIEGDSGKLYLGRLETVTRRPEAELAEVTSWRAQDQKHERGKSTRSVRRTARGSELG
jgi:pyruvate,orthophosphate dikinase